MEQALIGLNEKIYSLNVHVFSWEFSKSSGAQLEMGGDGPVMFPRGHGHCRLSSFWLVFYSSIKLYLSMLLCKFLLILGYFCQVYIHFVFLIGRIVALEVTILLLGMLILSYVKILKHCVRVWAHNITLLI